MLSCDASWACHHITDKIADVQHAAAVTPCYVRVSAESLVPPCCAAVIFIKSLSVDPTHVRNPSSFFDGTSFHRHVDNGTLHIRDHHIRRAAATAKAYLMSVPRDSTSDTVCI